jgi:hypothetical protein
MTGSPFALFFPKDLDFQVPVHNEETIKKQKLKNHLEFAVYRLPCTLETHASSPIIPAIEPKLNKHRRHKRSSSIVIDTVGILTVPCKKVSFSSTVCKYSYKADM